MSCNPARLEAVIVMQYQVTYVLRIIWLNIATQSFLKSYTLWAAILKTTHHTDCLLEGINFPQHLSLMLGWWHDVLYLSLTNGLSNTNRFVQFEFAFTEINAFKRTEQIFQLTYCAKGYKMYRIAALILKFIDLVYRNHDTIPAPLIDID